MRIATFVLLILPYVSWGMPSLARRYEASCSTCHTQPPQLNAFGEAFRASGYTWPQNGDEQGKIKDTPIVMSADANREAWPDSFLPSDIPHIPAIGFQVGSTAAWTAPNPLGNISFSGSGVPLSPPSSNFNQLGHFDLSSLNEGVDLFVIGRAAPNLTYFAELGFYSPSMTFAIERAMLVFANIGGPALLNVKIGRFEPEVSFLTGFRKLVGGNYDIMTRTLGQPSRWSLEPLVNQSGVEVNGVTLKGRFRYNFAVLEPYTGVPASLGGNGVGLPNNTADTYLHLETKWGGLRLDGFTPEEATAGPVEPWVDDAIWLGAYAYRGTHDVDLARAYSGLGATGVLDQRDLLWRFGADVKWTRGSFWLIVAGAFEIHDLSQVSAPAATIARNSIHGLFGSIEAQYIVFPWLIPYLTIDYFSGTNPYLVNAGWAAIGAGVATTPLSAANTPAVVTEWTVRPAVSIHIYMNWKLFAYAEFARLPLQATLQPGTLQLADVTVGTKLDF